jgi:hypothetical protein
MATTTNYGWAEPDNTSLVRNGAQDIRILGDAIDASVWNIGYGQAGKNKIINGNFGIWQRGTSLVGAGYIADRFQSVVTTTTVTQSQQAFTPGAAPVAGYESQYFYRAVTVTGGTAGSRALVQQAIEDVRTFAGNTVTVSFYAKAASGTPKIGVELAQVFGSGGSSAVTGIGATAVTISTSWTRYTVTASVPSITGKTIGTGSSLNVILWIDAGADFAARASSIGNQSGTFDIWGVQAEYGSKATPFQTASGGSPQAELAMCQRYYWRTANLNQRFGLSFVYNTTTAYGTISYPVEMRTSTITLETTGTAGNYGVFAGASTFQNTVVPAKDISTTTNMSIGFTNAGTMTAGQAGFMSTHAGAVAYLGFNGEL